MKFIMSLLMLVLFFKITGFALGIFGKILGVVFSMIGYLILGVILVSVFGFAVISLPIVMIVGIFSIIGALGGI